MHVSFCFFAAEESELACLMTPVFTTPGLHVPQMADTTESPFGSASQRAPDSSASQDASASKKSSRKTAEPKKRSSERTKSMTLHDKKKAALTVSKTPATKGKGTKKGKDTATEVKEKKKHTYCLAIRAHREMKKAVKDSWHNVFAIPHAPVDRLVREIGEDVKPYHMEADLRFTKDAVKTLHEFLEHFGRTLMSQVNLMAEGGRRMGIKPKDFKLLRLIKENSQDGLMWLNHISEQKRVDGKQRRRV